MLSAAGFVFGAGLTLSAVVTDSFSPYADPGLSHPQFIAIAVGLAICTGAIFVGSAQVRSRFSTLTGLHIATAVAVSLLSLVALELILGATGMTTYYPPDILDKQVQAATWWVCDELGCHYDYERTVAACDQGLLYGRHCIVNRQGFADLDDFISSDDHAARARILFMGDSFTHGFSAQVGMSYVETLEAALPDAVVWNLGITATGTSQNIAAFETFSPRLKPQLSILGFYMNDFLDNRVALNGGLHLEEAEGTEHFIMRYQIDRWGNPLELTTSSDFAYVTKGYIPPANEFERLVASTRMGTLALQLLDKVGAPFHEPPLAQLEPRTRQYLTQLRDAVAEQGSRLLVLLIPQRSDIVSPSEEFLLAIKLMEYLGIPYLNPIDQLEFPQDYVDEIDIHWSDAGHQKIGALLTACIETFLAEEKLTPCDYVVVPEAGG